MSAGKGRAVVQGPFAGIGSQFLFPAHQLEAAQLVAISGQFTSDATVGTRTLFAEIRSPEGAAVAWVGLGDVVASDAMQFSLVSSLTCNPEIGAGGSVHGGLPCCGLWEGCRVAVYDVNSISAGDSFSSMVQAICLG